MIAPESRTLRIAVVGAGFMGRQHVGFIRASRRAELVAIADHLPADVPDFGCPVYGDTSAMLQAARPDAVIIANPNAFHVETALECIDAGVAVLLEKPLATGYAESLRLVDAVNAAESRFLVGHHRRHHPAIARARAAVDGDEIGDLVGVSGLWSARKDDAYFVDVPWHSREGAGVALINLVHDLDLLRVLCGEVAEIQAMSSTQSRGLEVEDTLSLNLRFDSGAVGSFFASDAGVSPWGWDQATEESSAFPFLPNEVAYRLVGTRGALSVPNLAKYTYDSSVTPDWRSPLSRTYLAVGPGHSFHAQLEHFIDVATGVAAPLVSAEDASRTLALVEAAALAARTGASVDVARFRADLATAVSS